MLYKYRAEVENASGRVETPDFWAETPAAAEAAAREICVRHKLKFRRIDPDPCGEMEDDGFVTLHPKLEDA